MRVYSSLLTVSAMVGRLFYPSKPCGFTDAGGETPAGPCPGGPRRPSGRKPTLLWGAYLALACMAWGCGPAARLEPPVPPATGAVVWSPEEAKRLVEERDSHAAKAATLEDQLIQVRKAIAALKAEEGRVSAELKEERLAAARVRLYWWLSICAILAGACVLAAFVLPSASVWATRGAIGFAALAAILGTVALLLAWWVWVGAGLIVAGLVWWLASRALTTTNALTETVQGVENLKPVVGSVYKAIMKQAQSPRTDTLLNAIRKRRAGA